MGSVGAYESTLEKSLQLVRLVNSLFKNVNGAGTYYVNSSVSENVTPKALIHGDSVNAEEKSLRFGFEYHSFFSDDSIFIYAEFERLAADHSAYLNDKRNYQPEEQQKPNIQSGKSALFSDV